MHRKAQFTDYYRRAFEEIKSKILGESDATIVGADSEELSDYHCQDYIFSPVEKDTSREPEYEHHKYQATVPAHRRESGYRDEGDLQFEHEKITVEIPIVHNEKIHTIAELESSTYLLGSSAEPINFLPDKIKFSIITTGYQLKLSEDETAGKVNQQMTRVEQLLSEKNHDITKGNAELRKNVLDFVLKRKQKIESDDQMIASLTKKINIPLKKKVDSAAKKNKVSRQTSCKKSKTLSHKTRGLCSGQSTSCRCNFIY